MSGTAFDTPTEAVEAEEGFVHRANVITKSGTTYAVSQKLSTALRYAREALTAGAEVKRPFFVELNTEAGKIVIAASEIAVIEQV